MSNRAMTYFLLLTGMLALIWLTPITPLPEAEAQGDLEAQAGQGLPPSEFREVPQAKEQTMAEMEKADEAWGPNGPDMPGPNRKPFLPTMNRTQYLRFKELLNQMPAQERSEESGAASTSPGPPVYVKDFEGVDQTAAGGWYPPDLHGAVGFNHFVEVTNSRLDIYSKATGAKVKSVTLAALFSWTSSSLFEPRVTFDLIWKRWVIIADSQPLADGRQTLQVAISKTADPLGSYWIYRIPVVPANSSGLFYDFPMLGWDQDAVIVTGNVFDKVDYLRSEIMVLSKARLYNGMSVLIPVFTQGTTGTIAPPIVLDQNLRTYCINAPGYLSPGGNIMKLFTLVNTSRNSPSLSISNVTVPAYVIPPPAKQPGTTATLDTLDARFVNNSYQVGNSLYNVHTINASGLPTPKFYEFTTSGTSATIRQQRLFFASNTSHDFNASLAVNPNNRNVFATWSATSPSGTTFNARVYFGGRQGADALNTFSVRGFLPGGTSSSYYAVGSSNPRPWGNYSAVSLEPSKYYSAWIVNEKINATTVWGSRIGNIRY